MSDIWSPKKRSAVMSKIRNKDTKPEVALRSRLHKLGFRFSLHKIGLPGKPDIVLCKYRTVIFVHGCFWHHHRSCRDGVYPKSNQEFWREKLTRNIMRDRQHRKSLGRLGWHVLTVWECEIENREEEILDWIVRQLRFIETRRSHS